jgi:hypothetical protein
MRSRSGTYRSASAAESRITWDVVTEAIGRSRKSAFRAGDPATGEVPDGDRGGTGRTRPPRSA